MSTIRERNAQFARLTTAHPDIRFMCAGPGEDRHALLTAGDALAKAADEADRECDRLTDDAPSRRHRGVERDDGMTLLADLLELLAFAASVGLGVALFVFLVLCAAGDES